MNDPAVRRQGLVASSVRSEFYQLQQDLETLNNGMSANALAFAVDDLTSESSLRYNFTADLGQQRASTRRKMGVLAQRLRDEFPESERPREITVLINEISAYTPPARVDLSRFDDYSDENCLSRTMYEAFQLLPRNDPFYRAIAALPEAFDSREWSRDVLFVRLNRIDIPSEERIQLQERMNFLAANPLLTNLFNSVATGPQASELSTAQNDAFRVLRNLSRNCPSGGQCWHEVAHDEQKMNDYRRAMSAILARPQVRAIMAQSSQDDINEILSPERVINPAATPIRNPHLYLERLPITGDVLARGCRSSERLKCIIEMARQCEGFPPAEELRGLPDDRGDPESLINVSFGNLLPRSSQYEEFVIDMCQAPIPGNDGRSQSFVEFRESYCRSRENAANCRRNNPAGHRAILLAFFDSRNGAVRNMHGMADFLRTARFGEITPEMARVARGFNGNLNAFEARHGRDSRIGRNGRFLRGRALMADAQVAEVNTRDVRENSRVQGRDRSNGVQSSLDPVTTSTVGSNPGPSGPATTAQAATPQDYQRQIESGFARARAAAAERDQEEISETDAIARGDTAAAAASRARIEELERELSELSAGMNRALAEAREVRDLSRRPAEQVQQLASGSGEGRRDRDLSDESEDQDGRPAPIAPGVRSNVGAQAGQTVVSSAAQTNLGGSALGSSQPLGGSGQRGSSAVSGTERREGNGLYQALYEGRVENLRLTGEPDHWGPETVLSVDQNLYTQIEGRDQRTIGLISTGALAQVESLRTTAPRVYIQVRTQGRPSIPVIAIRRDNGTYDLQFEGQQAQSTTIQRPERTESDMFEALKTTVQGVIPNP